MIVAYTVFGLAGEIASPMRPRAPVGSPFVIFCHVLPASDDLYSAEPGPASRMVHARRNRSMDAAYSTLESLGLATTSMNPVVSLSPLSTRAHVLPPSEVLYTPRSPPERYRGPCAATYTVLGSLASIAMRPMCHVSLSPMFAHVLPPSVDLYTPSP